MVDLKELEARIKAGERIPLEMLKEAVVALRAGRGSAMQSAAKGTRSKKAKLNEDALNNLRAMFGKTS